MWHSKLAPRDWVSLAVSLGGERDLGDLEGVDVGEGAMDDGAVTSRIPGMSAGEDWRRIERWTSALDGGGAGFSFSGSTLSETVVFVCLNPESLRARSLNV